MDTRDQIVSALRALCEREGGYKTVAAVAGVSAANLDQILKGVELPSGKARSVGRDLASKLEAKYPGWTNEQHSTRGRAGVGTPVAQLLSYPKVSDPPLLAWEDLLKPYLPPTFRVTLSDDSMAPWLLPGDVVKFRTDAPPVRGQPVLLRDSNGGLYVRLYRARSADQWIAAPLNPAFDSLDSVRDGLTLVGVFVGMDRP